MKVLVAGIGNVFLGDDGFGVETVRRLSLCSLAEGVTVKDFGMRGFDLACSLSGEWDLVILVDAVQKGGAPGSVYVIELNRCDDKSLACGLDPHGLDPVRAIELANAIGEVTARLLLVGCEPANLGGDEGFWGLSEPVEGSIEGAMKTIAGVISRFQKKVTGRRQNQELSYESGGS
jgi:hydrogenase maturation protease